MPEQCYVCKVSCSLKEKCHAGEVFGCPCDGCRNIVCRNCSKISSTEIRAVLLSNRAMFFFCEACSEAIKVLPSFQSKIPELEREIRDLKKAGPDTVFLEEIRSDLSEVQREIVALKNLTSKTPSYADVVSNLNKETKVLKDNIDEIKNTISKAETHGTGVARCVSEGIEPTLQEIQERNIRASNVLVFGAEEATSDNIEDRTAHNARIVEEILTSVNGTAPIDQLEIIRIGRYDPDKRRPIKITFPSKEDALKILKNKAKLPRETGTYIKYDMTSMQRNYIRKLTEELKDRINRGEKNLKIKYFGGTPKIVQIRPPKTRIEQTDGTEAKN